VIRREFNGVSTPVPLIRQKPIYVSFHFVIGEFELVYLLAALVAIPFGDIEEYISNLGAKLKHFKMWFPMGIYSNQGCKNFPKI